MADEPSLPCLPGVSWDEQAQTFSNKPRKRGRSRQSYEALPASCNSSDPAVFSSDDDPGLDNYTEGRRKKRYIGSWFQQHPASSDSAFSEPTPAPRTKRKLARQVDSGVFLGSDDSESKSDVEDVNMAPPVPRLPQLSARPVPSISPEETIAREKIQACIEQGSENIMLWSASLKSLSNDVVTPLKHFCCVPVVVKDVAFEHKKPEIKINLGSNFLSRLPGALFDVSYLTCLSLRGNQLVELPQGIGRLENLRELNISQNRLRTLPAELLDLIDKSSTLQNLSLHPNPFQQPGWAAGTLEKLVLGRHGSPLSKLLSELEGWPDFHPHMMSRHVGRSAVGITDSQGRVLWPHQQRPGLPDDKLPILCPEDDRAKQQLGPEQQKNARGSPVASLVELVLRRCYKSEHLANMIWSIPQEYTELRQSLERAAQVKEQGGLACSRCGTGIVMPKVTWIEWRELATCRTSKERMTIQAHSSQVEESAVPFYHRGCSERCGPPETYRNGWRAMGRHVET